MRQRIAAVICTAAAALAPAVLPAQMMNGTSLTAYAEGEAANLVKVVSADGRVSRNKTADNYEGDWAGVVKSYIYEENGKTVRLELTGEGLIAETYSANMSKPENTEEIALELAKFGGAYIGKEYNFVVSAADNADEDDTLEFLAVTKYDKNWNRLGSCLLAAEEASYMFDYGSLRMTESGGVLYVHTSYQRYKNSSGENTQSSFTFCVKESDMSWERDTRPYTSHSFNQFVRVENDTEYLLDHGDCYDRAVKLTAVSVSSPEANARTTEVLKIGSTYAESGTKTGVCVGGFEISKNALLTAGCMTDQNDIASSTQYNVFLCVTKKDMSSTERVMLTEYPEGANVSVGVPKLTPIDSDRFCLLWEETSETGGAVLKTAVIDGSGNIIETHEDKSGAFLSDCEPVLFSDGTLRWYFTDNSSPVFCTLGTGANQQEPAERLPGDCNGDGSVNLLDLGVLQRKLCNWDIEINASNADVNGSGSIDLGDLGLLQRYLCGWSNIELL